MKKGKSFFTPRLGRFFKTESSGGLITIMAALIALIASNGSSAEWYQSFINTPITIGYAEQSMTETLANWVKDVLMVFFFLLVGMELKREMLTGFLSDKKQILLPLLAAIGGMIVPAAIFMLINHETPQNWNGWAIASATDIAFAICILTLAGKGIPPALKIFLLAIAIFDDLGAILIIAIFYSGKLAIVPLLGVLGCGLLLFVLNKLRIMLTIPYILAGIILWFCLHASGIHTTIGGVMVGMAIPLRNPKNAAYSPLNHFMHTLHPWVNFLILPIFAFVAAGVNLQTMNVNSLLSPLPLGITLGLFIGKQIGIFFSSWLIIKSGMAKLPENTNFQQIYGVSIIAGIGFTMSLFIGNLAFADPLMQEQVKLGVLSGTALSTIFGWLVLRQSIVTKV
jgi:Na+:H+ antiporter, NhaA family